MVKHTKNLLLFLVLVLTFSIMSVSAVTVTVPANGATISGLTLLNATHSTNLSNCTFYAKSDSTANNTWARGLLGKFTNDTGADLIYINGSFQSSILEDGSDYQFNATCLNMTGGVFSAVGTATVIVNNGVPASPTSTSPATDTLITSVSSNISFSGTVTEANTTSCTYVIARGGATSGSDYYTGSATKSGTNCSFTKIFTDTNDNGNWYWMVVASDGRDTTNSVQNILQVQIPAVGGNLDTAQQNEAEAQQQTTEGSNTIYWIIGIVVVVVIVIIIFKRR